MLSFDDISRDIYRQQQTVGTMEFEQKKNLEEKQVKEMTKQFLN